MLCSQCFRQSCCRVGEIAHGGAALLWKYAIDDFITPLETINSDRIVGIKCDFPYYSPLFILSV